MITGGKPALMRIKFINSLNMEFGNHNIAKSISYLKKVAYLLVRPLPSMNGWMKTNL